MGHCICLSKIYRDQGLTEPVLGGQHQLTHKGGYTDI